MARRLRWAGRWPDAAPKDVLVGRRGRRDRASGGAVAAGRWIGIGLAMAAFAFGAGLALWSELGRRR